MTWTAPSTQAVGTLITASMYNNQIINNIAHIGSMLVGGVAISGIDAGEEIGIESGVYTGNNGTTQAITGVGFLPRGVFVWRQSSATNGIVVVKTDQDPSNNSMVIAAIATSFQSMPLYSADAIRSLDADGFTVGDTTGMSANLTNASATTYTWIAWR